MRDYIVCWDSFERFLAFQIKNSDGRGDIYVASESTSDDEPPYAQRDRVRRQAHQWRSGSVPISQREKRAVKIGRSRRDTTERLQEIQTGNWRPLFDVCVIPVQDAVLVERELHRAFARDFVLGEWYTLSPGVHQMIGFLIECHEATVLRSAAR